jgi:methylthioribose-1-phosphate isomerase
VAILASGVRALRWDGRRLAVLDQSALPAQEAWLELEGAPDTARAIARLAIRGAPNIGIAAAYGLAMEIAAQPGLGALERGADLLRDARPTAVNLARAVDRVREAALGASVATMAAAARAEAQRLHAEEDAASEAIARHGAAFLYGASRILTHCNTGGLATGGTGSALAVAVALPDVRVLACETRPLLQGARLTAWELDRLEIPFELCVDAAAAGLISRGEVDAVIVGCDRVAANGDVANKVGTYAHALAAHAAGIPFVVAGPTSSIDLATPSGRDIVIEERDPVEVSDRYPARNPAFDVTPAHLVSALVTERGVISPVTGPGLAALLA